MKKLISIALMLALCLTLFAGCDIISLFTPAPSESLLAAQDYLDSYMKDLPTTTSLDFDVLGVVAIDGNIFNVEWTSDNESITLEANAETGLVKVVLPGAADAAVTYTLTATLSEDSGAKVSSTYTFTIPASVYVVAPEVGKTYKLGFVSNYDEKQALAYYFTGAMSGFYGGTTVAFDAAKDVTLEKAEGGYYLTFMDGQTKKYIGVVYELSSKDNAYHLNFVLREEAPCVFTFDTKLSTFATTVKIDDVDTICYLGTAGKYNTFDSIKATDVKADTWLAHFYAVDANPNFNANDPADGSTLTITEANALGKSKPSNVYSSNKFNVTGKISKIDGKKLYIKDTDGNQLYAYGFTAGEGVTIKVGDTITVNGIIGCYSGTAQMKDVTITAHTAHTCEYSDPTCTEAATCIHCGATTGEKLGHTDANKDHTCDIESCGATNVGTHADGDDEDLLCDYGCGKEVTATESHEVTVSTTIADYASANNWADATQYSTLTLDGITVTATGSDQNTGKYYANGNNWRMYQKGTPSITVKAAEGKTIVSVKITYTPNNTGVLTLNNENITSDTVVSVNANSVTFSVGNSGTADNGQARITAIEVTYK